MFTRLENGAEVEMEVVTYVVSGAEQEAEAVYAVKDGAEEAVWSATSVVCSFDSITKNNTKTNCTYNVKDNGKSLTYSIDNSSWTDSYSYIKFHIQKNDGFKGTVKVKYTLTQSVTNNQCALRFANSGGTALSSNTTFNNTTNCTNKTFEGTVTLSSKLDYILLRIHAYADKDINGTISYLYINDELVKFV